LLAGTTQVKNKVVHIEGKFEVLTDCDLAFVAVEDLSFLQKRLLFGVGQKHCLETWLVLFRDQLNQTVWKVNVTTSARLRSGVSSSQTCWSLQNTRSHKLPVRCIQVGWWPSEFSTGVTWFYRAVHQAI